MTNDKQEQAIKLLKASKHYAHNYFCMHNLDLTGKCFKCGEQYIRKEGN